LWGKNKGVQSYTAVFISNGQVAGFKLTKKEVERSFLTEMELQAIASKQFLTDRLNYVRDIFLFSCFTGLAYADARKLKRTEIAVGLDGEQWIFIKRQTPALPPAFLYFLCHWR
jgi:hypothetical protein